MNQVKARNSIDVVELLTQWAQEYEQYLQPSNNQWHTKMAVNIKRNQIRTNIRNWALESYCVETRTFKSHDLYVKFVPKWWDKIDRIVLSLPNFPEQPWLGVILYEYFSQKQPGRGAESKARALNMSRKRFLNLLNYAHKHIESKL